MDDDDDGGGGDDDDHNSGMVFLHRHPPPILHHDLKSNNLLVDERWTVKVCDFGNSRFCEVSDHHTISHSGSSNSLNHQHLESKFVDSSMVYSMTATSSPSARKSGSPSPVNHNNNNNNAALFQRMLPYSRSHVCVQRHILRCPWSLLLIGLSNQYHHLQLQLLLH